MDLIRDIEFYNTPEGDVMIRRQSLPVKVLEESDREFITAMIQLIEERYSESYMSLTRIYSKSLRNRILFEYKIVRRFIKCNFGEYDQKLDVDHLGSFHFEEVHCPLRGECEDECVICKPKINTRITNREMEIYRRIVEGKEAAAIADELFISVATVNRHRENIKSKINVNTVVQMVKYWNDNHLD